MDFHWLHHIYQGMRLALPPPSVTRSISSPRLDPPAPAAPPPPAARRPRRARRVGARGFTLPELLAVVAVIGVLAATASPMFINLMRDRRVNKATMEISGLYRIARSRAMGRGTSVMVRWDGAVRTFDVWERIVQEQEQIVVGPGCNITWGGANTKGITSMTFGNTSSDQLSAVDFRDGTGASAAYSEICFTPRGRTFVRYSAASAFTPLANVPSVQVTNQRTGLVRTVFIPPNGVARMGL